MGLRNRSRTGAVFSSVRVVVISFIIPVSRVRAGAADERISGFPDSQRAMADCVLLFRGQFGHGETEFGEQEDRVVPKAVFAPGFANDAAPA